MFPFKESSEYFMKRYSSFFITLLIFFVGICNVKALTIDGCDVIVSYKASSSLDKDSYICKNQVFGSSTNSIYYAGKGNKIVLNNFSAYYFSLESNVVLEVTGTNNISLLHTGEYQLNVNGSGNIRFKEDSYVKKINNGELVYNYLYQGKTIINNDRLIYEGTEKEFINDYKELASINKLPNEYNEENFEKVQAIDFVSMTSVSITDEWLNKHIVTNLDKSVEDGYGVVKYVEKKKEEPKEDDSKTLKDDKVILVSEKKMNAKYKLHVDDLSEEKEKYSDQVDNYDILSLYDVSVYNGKKQVEMKNGHYTIKIKLDDSDKSYQSYKVIYVNEDKVAEYLDATIEDGYIVFETSHLSQYGIIAEEITPVVEAIQPRKITLMDLFKVSILGGFILISSLLILILVIKSGLIKRRKRRRA